MGKFALVPLSNPPNRDPEIILDRGDTFCGRDRSNHIVCPSVIISRYHCVFYTTDDEVTVIDSMSGNGVYVNSRRIDVSRRLCIGDKISIGHPGDNINFTRLYMYELNQISDQEDRLVAQFNQINI